MSQTEIRQAVMVRLNILASRVRASHRRLGVYDEFLNAVPCGYDKQSPKRQRPRFHRGPLQMIGWLVALVYNAIGDLANHLPAYYHGMHVSTLRRTFFNRPGQLYCTPNTLIVYLDSFSEQEALIPLIDQINQQQYPVPWLDDRRLVLSLTPSNLPRPGP